MGEWTVDVDDATATVAVGPGRAVRLTLAAEVGELVGDGKVAVTAVFPVEHAERWRILLGAAIGIAGSEPS